MLVVNLFGAPGAGKSTLALLTAGFLKIRHPDLTIECPAEFAKAMVYNDSIKPFKHQLYLTGNQYWEVARCEGHVDIVVTDSPVLLGAIYGRLCDPPTPPQFTSVCEFYHRQYPSLNALVHRKHSFETTARVHDEAQSDELHYKIGKQLYASDVRFHDVVSSEGWAADLADMAAGYARKLKLDNAR